MHIFTTGERYGRLVLISIVEQHKCQNKKWICKCDCGNTTIVSTNHLTNGHTRSCGCMVEERRTTHTYSKTRMYNVWVQMKNRCKTRDKQHAKYYSSRGIKVCIGWEKDFMSFREWALSHGYSDNLTIDRINNYKGYSPANCRWIPKNEQSRNMRKNIYLTHNGEQKLLADWAREYSKKYNMAYVRFKKGRTFEEIFA